MGTYVALAKSRTGISQQQKNDNKVIILTHWQGYCFKTLVYIAKNQQTNKFDVIISKQMTLYKGF